MLGNFAMLGVDLVEGERAGAIELSGFVDR